MRQGIRYLALQVRPKAAWCIDLSVWPAQGRFARLLQVCLLLMPLTGPQVSSEPCNSQQVHNNKCWSLAAMHGVKDELHQSEQ